MKVDIIDSSEGYRARKNVYEKFSVTHLLVKRMLNSKTSPFAERMPEINRVIEKLRNDGTLERLIAKYEK